MNLIRKWFANDNIKKQGWIQNGKKEGTHYLFWQSGQPRSVNNYLNGKLHGAQKYYYFTGQIKKQVEYFHGIKNGLSETHSIEGELTLQCFYLNNKLHGEYYEFDGLTTVRANYTRGVLNGPRKAFEASSMTLQTTDYQNNQKNGDSLVYTDDGILIKHLRYKDNKLHGECREYHNGLIYCIQNFKDGLKHGDFIIFFQSGLERKIQIMAKYKNNKLVSWKKFDQNGKLLKDQNPIFRV